MNRLQIVVVLMLLGVATGAGIQPRVVHACGGPDDGGASIRNADLVVEGWITSWEKAADVKAPGGYIAIRVLVVPTRVHQGSLAGNAVLLDRASLLEGGSGADWGGSGGMCGTFNEDPVGMYVITAVHRYGGAELQIDHPDTLFLGPRPEGLQYDRARQRLSELLRPGPPSTGTGLAPRDSHGHGPLLRLTAVMLAGVCVATVLTVLKTVGGGHTGRGAL